MTVTSEDVCFNLRNVNLIQSIFLDHVFSLCNVCNRCLVSFSSEIEMAKEQVYLCCQFILFFAFDFD